MALYMTRLRNAVCSTRPQAFKLRWIAERSRCTLSRLSIIDNAMRFPDRTAIVDTNGVFSYKNLIDRSSILCTYMKDLLSRQAGTNSGYNGLVRPRIAFMCPSNISYVITQWATWSLNCVAVPLCTAHPPSLLEYFIKDSQSSMLVTTEDFAESLSDVASNCKVELLVLPKNLYTKAGVSESVPDISFSREPLQKDHSAQIVYSSGTTGRPKGILASHGNIKAQVMSLVSAWKWSAEDRILHTLPLHHIHGIVNCLLCPLWVGATCIMLPKFDAKEVWKVFLGYDPGSFAANGISIRKNLSPNLYMAVPTIYAKLIQEYHEMQLNEEDKEKIRRKMDRLRLMVSGSASLPEPVMETWEKITGHRLLERYGMTEIGMALSNPYRGNRLAGYVGKPLPGVEVRIVTEDGEIIVEGNELGSKENPERVNTAGELQIRGESVFSSYWERPEVTKESFTSDGWFKTGDTCVYKEGNYKILGRTSVDIIKSGGYKISALDIERHLLAHDSILDCAVFGVPDDVWGEAITAVMTTKQGYVLTLKDLREWLSNFLPMYSLPSKLHFMETIPRNQMGKVNKKELMRIITAKKEELDTSKKS